jgi:hypothetical protein
MTESISSSSSKDIGFFGYVFNFDDDNKAAILNMLQYTVLAIIPVLVILKVTKYIVPEEDESKGSLEIMVESIGQVLIIMLSIWFTNKIINYIPTYSGEKYHGFNEISFIIPFLIILATMQTKLGAKLNILMDRVTSLYKGTPAVTTANQGSGNGSGVGNTMRITQPLATQHQPSQADYLDRSQILPSNPQMSSMPPQQSPDFNQMYQNQATPIQPEGMMNSNGPMAANEAIGGGGFGSMW